MKAQPLPVSDDDLNRLLNRRYCDTSADFEVRWTELKRGLRQAPASRAPAWRTYWSVGLGVVGALAVLTFVITLRPPQHPGPAIPEISPQLAELFAMEATLSQAAPLLSEENRTALLHLPAPRQES